jgi:glycosyltransferase involved in cell wall biosynthesis
MSPAPEVSIVISTFNRLPLWRRTLWGIAKRPPSVPFEVIVVDDNSTEPVLEELHKYSSRFPWTTAKLDMEAFERATGVKKFFNNPSLSFNAGVRLARGSLIFQQGNEVIPWDSVYDGMLAEKPNTDDFVLFSTTLDMPPEILNWLDVYGDNLSPDWVHYCRRWPLASPHFHTDVTNYVSLCSRSLFEKLGGYDERYVGGIGKEDTDFIRRCRKTPGWTDEQNMRRTTHISLHQSHGGRTCYYLPKPEVITQQRWAEGEVLSKVVWDSWDGGYKAGHTWDWGTIGVKDVCRNF